MPRRKANTLTVQPWPKLRKGRLYKGKVKTVHLKKASHCLKVRIVNLDPSQADRIHEMDLPLPVRPGNRTCAFLAACGIDATTVGNTVNLDQTADRVIGLRSRGQGDNGSEEFDFEEIPDKRSEGVDGSADTPTSSTPNEGNESVREMSPLDRGSPYSSR